jgi:hemoglobin-like flavoprotein
LIVTHMVEPERLLPELEAFGRTNSRLGIRAEHYPIACACLLEALCEAAGDAWNADLEREWRFALDTVSRAMIRGGDQDPRRA